VPEESLLLGALEELKRVLGEDAFVRFNREIAAPDREDAGLGLSPADLSRRPSELSARARRCVTAFAKDVLSPNVAILSVPLLVLTLRDKVTYVIDQAPWPESAPPQRLVHLASTGFDSKLGWGIVAFPTSSPDVWVVSKFSRSYVELNWNRASAVLKEFPWLNDLGNVVAKTRATLEAVHSDNRELREAKGRLEEMLAQGFFAFTQQIDPKSFKVFCTIMAEGDVAKASRKLKMPDSTLRALLYGWGGQGKAYGTMLDLVRWRKKVGRKQKVSLNDAIEHETAKSANYPNLIADVLDGLLSMTGDNWREIAKELADLLRPNAPR
jgi:hypothetical protein